MLSLVIIFCYFAKINAVTATIFKNITLNFVKTPQNSFCFSSECVLVASRIHGWMDNSINPCENFYKYSCGGFLADTCLNESEIKVTPFTMLSEHIWKQLVKVLNEPTANHGNLAPFVFFKTAYAKCASEKGMF